MNHLFLFQFKLEENNQSVNGNRMFFKLLYNKNFPLFLLNFRILKFKIPIIIFFMETFLMNCYILFNLLKDSYF